MRLPSQANEPDVPGIGLVPEARFEAYRAKCETCLREMLRRGEYIGWLARPNEL